MIKWFHICWKFLNRPCTLHNTHLMLLISSVPRGKTWWYEEGFVMWPMYVWHCPGLETRPRFLLCRNPQSLVSPRTANTATARSSTRVRRRALSNIMSKYLVLIIFCWLEWMVCREQCIIKTNHFSPAKGQTQCSHLM